MLPTKNEDETAQDSIKPDFLDELGISPEEQQQMEDAAYSGAADDIASNAGLSGADLYRAESGSAGATSQTSEADNDEGGKFGFREEDEKKSIRARVSNLSRRAKIGIGTGMTSGLLGILGLFGFGSLQLPHLAQMLSLDSVPSEEDADVRMNALYRYAKSGGDAVELRLSYLGSKRFHNGTIPTLDKNGVTLKYHKTTGVLQTMTYDLDKNSVTKDVKGRSAQIKALARNIGIPESDLTVAGKEASITGLNERSASYNRKVTKNTVNQIPAAKKNLNAKLNRALLSRNLGRALNIRSIFHPIKRADASIAKKATTLDLKRQAAKEMKSGKEYKSARATEAYKSLQEKTSGLRAGAGAALLVTAATCMARDSAKEAAIFNREAVVLPQAVEAGRMISIGSQQQSGMDFDPSQLDVINQLLTDEDGKTIWQSKALQSRSGEATTGEDMPPEYEQAFSGSGAVKKLENFGGKAGAAACSDFGKAAQLIGGGLLLGLSLPTGGGSTAIYGALKLGAGVAGSAAVMIGLQKLITESLKDGEIPDDVSAPVKGSLLAYGSREFANMNARTTGGVELSAQESAMIDREIIENNQSEFNSKPFLAKVFDVKDYRSVAGTFIRSNSSARQDLKDISQNAFNIGTAVANTLHSLSPKARADTDVYDYGFNRYGIPKRILDNKDYDDPYKNAEIVAKLLDGGGGQAYIDRAKTCFNVTVSKDSGMWSVMPQEGDVNPNSAEYEDANCNDSGDANWDRMILFVFDNMTMESVACYMGEEDSCKVIGATIDENICSVESGTGATTSIAGMPAWAKLPVVTAPVGGPVNGTIDYAMVNARSYDTFPDVLRIITGNNPDFIGLNEIANESIKRMEDSAPGYGAWKNNVRDTTKGNDAQSVNNAIMWKKDKWELLQSGSMKITEDDMVVFKGENKIWDRFAVWGVFKRKSDGAITSFISTHMMTNPAEQKKQHGDPPMTRIEQYGLSMDLLIQLTQTLSKHGPVVVAGDMNSHPKNGDWAAVPKMEAAGYGWVNDNAVIYVFNPKGTKITKNRIVTVPLHGDHQDHSLLTKIDMRGTGPGASGSAPVAATSPTGDCAAIGNTNYKNPIIDSQAPDPSIIKGEDGKYYLYATGFQQFVSKDTVKWDKKNDGMSWIKGAPNWTADRWAPDIAKVGDMYVLSVSGGNGGSRAIGYATSKSAGGPFTWQGMYNLPTSDGGGYNIDPNVVETDKGIFMYYGSGRGYIKAAKLKVDGGKLKVDGSPKKVFTTNEGVGPTLAEGAYVHKKGDYYYLFYSSGNWDGSSPEYRLHVARSKDPTGPFKGKGQPILQSNEQFKSPGHGSVLTDEAGTDWKIYHAYQRGKDYRAVLMDKITYVDDWPTIDGPSSGKQAGPAIAGAGGGGSSSVNMGDDYKSPQCENFRKGGAPGLACDGECVDFVKFRLKKNINRDKFASLGNGKDVAIGLGRAGYKVDNKPAVNAVVSWGAGQFGMNETYGHTAMVSAVNKDGSITVEEYNVTPGKYGTRKIPADQASKLTYAHTEVDFK